MELTMLIVDDVDVNRAVLKVVFEEQYDIIEAQSAVEALEILEACAGNIDIMILDIMMPEMTGVELLKKYQHEPYFEKVPVVVITSSNTMEDQIDAFAAGANDFITKPFMPEIVMTRVKNVVASSKKVLDMQKEREALKVQSEIDQLTGLFNKVTAQANIRNELALNPRGIHAMLMIDIDNFKSVNDNEGHMVGDKTIKVIANQIMAQFRKSDVLSRFGGDEFCVFMSNLPDKEIARKKAHELAMLLKYKPNLTIPANVSLSIGLSFSDRENLSYEEMFKMADEALYNAKEAGKSRMCEYGKTCSSVDMLSQSVVLLLSRNRSVCSNVHAALGVTNAVVECGIIDNLVKMEELIKDKTEITFVDLSEEKDAGEGMLKTIREKYSWIHKSPFICCYKEGEIEQAKMAIMSGAKDILSIPFDIKTVHRMVDRHLPHTMDETKEIVVDGIDINS